MVSPAVAEAGYPVSDIDPFLEDYLREPYPFHAQLREAGPVRLAFRMGQLGGCQVRPKSLPFARPDDILLRRRGRRVNFISSSLGVRRAAVGSGSPHHNPPPHRHGRVLSVPI